MFELYKYDVTFIIKVLSYVNKVFYQVVPSILCKTD